jgi:hypothetical protein
MDTITAAAVAGVTAVAAEAAKEGATHLAKSAWGKIKGVLGWKDDPPPAEVEARAEKALAAKPELTGPIEKIVADYRQQIGGVSVGPMGSIDLREAKVGTVKQINVAHNEGGIQA